MCLALEVGGGEQGLGLIGGLTGDVGDLGLLDGDGALGERQRDRGALGRAGGHPVLDDGALLNNLTGVFALLEDGAGLGLVGLLVCLALEVGGGEQGLGLIGGLTGDVGDLGLLDGDGALGERQRDRGALGRLLVTASA